MAAQRELKHAAVWYLVDSVTPQGTTVKAKTVLSASFNSEVAKVSKDIIHSFVWHVH